MIREGVLLCDGPKGCTASTSSTTRPTSATTLSRRLHLFHHTSHNVHKIPIYICFRVFARIAWASGGGAREATWRLHQHYTETKAFPSRWFESRHQRDGERFFRRQEEAKHVPAHKLLCLSFRLDPTAAVVVLLLLHENIHPA